jgi:polyhydroxyalkanoate synthase
MFFDSPPKLAPTPKDAVARFGTATLYRFRAPDGVKEQTGVPFLLVPSMINRWFVLDLREGASFAAAMVAADPNRPVYVLDWGVCEDEDRYLTWDQILARLHHAARAVKKDSGASKYSLLGYCMGGTLAAIHAALRPEDIAVLINLLGPIDFSKAGMLGQMVDERWFDAQAIADAGNVTPSQMQNGFVAMRPTLSIAKWVGYADRMHDPAAREAFAALEAWSGDNVPFPGAAYATYIKDLYQANALVKGQHYVAGKRVDLKSITAPVLAIVAERDTICPPDAATALGDSSSAKVKDVLRVPGGHVGAVIGSKAVHSLYPKVAAWVAKNASAHKNSPESRL